MSNYSYLKDQIDDLMHSIDKEVKKASTEQEFNNLAELYVEILNQMSPKIIITDHCTRQEIRDFLFEDTKTSIDKTSQVMQDIYLSGYLTLEWNEIPSIVEEIETYSLTERK